MSCVLGFDYGTRLIGVAVGNRYTGTAQPVGVITNGSNGPDWVRCDAIFIDWKPDTLLVGLPLTLDGGEQAIAQSARAFANLLEQRYQRPVHLVDERLTSISAKHLFAQRRQQAQAKRKHAKTIDAIAAEIIVEAWLNELPPNDATK